MKKTALTVFVLLIIISLSLVWIYSPLAKYSSVEGVMGILRHISQSPWSSFLATGLYTLGGVFFFPVTVMTAAVVAIFGPIKGVLISYVGALLSGVIGFAAGQAMGRHRVKAMFGARVSAVAEKIKGTGVVGVALIRFVPIAPFPVVNMVFGVAGIPLITFIAGTILGFMPGKLALAFAGVGIFNAIEKPSPENILYSCIGLALWLGITLAAHKATRIYGRKNKRPPSCS